MSLSGFLLAIENHIICKCHRLYILTRKATTAISETQKGWSRGQKFECKYTLYTPTYSTYRHRGYKSVIITYKNIKIVLYPHRYRIAMLFRQLYVLCVINSDKIIQ